MAFEVLWRFWVSLSASSCRRQHLVEQSRGSVVYSCDGFVGRSSFVRLCDDVDDIALCFSSSLRFASTNLEGSGNDVGKRPSLRRARRTNVGPVRSSSSFGFSSSRSFPPPSTSTWTDRQKKKEARSDPKQGKHHFNISIFKSINTAHYKKHNYWCLTQNNLYSQSLLRTVKILWVSWSNLVCKSSARLKPEYVQKTAEQGRTSERTPRRLKAPKAKRGNGAQCESVDSIDDSLWAAGNERASSELRREKYKIVERRTELKNKVPLE